MNLKNNTFKILVRRLFTIVLMFCSFMTYSQIYEPNVLIVKLKPEHQHSLSQKSNLKALDTDVDGISPVFKNTTKSSQGLSRIYYVFFKGNKDAKQKIKELQALGCFEYCQPVYHEQLLYVPNDPRASTQYALSLCKAFEAWDIHKGDSTVVIGVTDTGVDFDNADLKTNVAYNTNDMIDGVDNDNDGYVDNYMGWDLGSNDNNPQYNQGNQGNLDHGVFTCGLAGARTDDNKGMAAIGFKTKFLPIKISNDYGYITRGYQAVVYAAQHGCKIINCSWGSTSPTPFGRDIIQYVTEDLDVIVVAAAGNNNDEYLFYPASYDNVVSVSASNSEDLKWESANYNWRVDIMAPGEGVLSTLGNGAFYNGSGTSFASPIVAGALALMYSYYPDTLSNRQLIEILKSSGDIIENLELNQPYKNKLGKSRLNLLNALQGNWGYAINSRHLQLMKDGRTAIVGDTAKVSLDITNYLLPARNIKVTIQSLTPEVTFISDSVFIIPQLGEEDELNSSQYNIEVKIDNSLYSNKEIQFLIQYDFDDFHTEEIRATKVSFPSMDVEVNRLSTTFFPEGRIGKNYYEEGIGFKLDNTDNILSEMGLVLSFNRNYLVSNVIRFQDFEPQLVVDSSRTDEMWQAEVKFINNSYVPVDVKAQYQFLLNDSMDNSMIINYQIINNKEVDYDAFYVGLFANWDIGYYKSNYTELDTTLQLAKTRSVSNNRIAGMQLLSYVPWTRYAMDNTNGNDSIDGYDGFGRNEVYWALTGQNYYEGILQNGVDIMDMISAGPLQLNAYDTLNLSFAVVVDSSMTEFMNEANSVRNYYNEINDIHFSIQNVDGILNTKVYPTVCRERLYIDTDNRESQILLYNLQGKLLKAYKSGAKTISISDIPNGMYLVRIGTYVGKVIVSR